MSVMLVAAILLPLADEFVVAIQFKLPALVTANRVVAKLSPEETPSPTVRPAYENEVYKIVAAQDPDANMVAEMKESQDNILAAIDAGLEVMGRSPEFQIKLHRPTGTEFVKGTLDELRMVREVVHRVGPW